MTYFQPYDRRPSQWIPITFVYAEDARTPYTATYAWENGGVPAYRVTSTFPPSSCPQCRLLPAAWQPQLISDVFWYANFRCAAGHEWIVNAEDSVRIEPQPAGTTA